MSLECKRCSELPVFKKKGINVCILVPTKHHIAPMKSELENENLSYSIDEDVFIAQETNLEQIVQIFDKMNLSYIEKRDIRLMPLDRFTDLDFKNLKYLRTLQYWMDVFSGKDFIYILENSSLITMFHPIVNPYTGEIYGYEALTRGIREDKSIMPPNELFEKARSMDLLFFLDRICRETVIKNASEQNITKKIFINFIPTSIYDPEKCLKSTDEALKKYNLSPENVVFEVVETEYIEDYYHLNNILSYYKDKGYGTALDDIGSGYSTIASLLSLDTDYMKIDMDLIKNIDKNIENQQKVRQYIQIAKENHIISLAEGVETKEELDILMEMGIELVQGYYFAKPSEVPPETLLNQ